MNSVKQTTQRLVTKVIPDFAQKLSNFVVHVSSYQQLSSQMHEHGINMR